MPSANWAGPIAQGFQVVLGATNGASVPLFGATLSQLLAPFVSLKSTYSPGALKSEVQHPLKSTR